MIRIRGIPVLAVLAMLFCIGLIGTASAAVMQVHSNDVATTFATGNQTTTDSDYGGEIANATFTQDVTTATHLASTKTACDQASYEINDDLIIASAENDSYGYAIAMLQGPASVTDHIIAGQHEIKSLCESTTATVATHPAHVTVISINDQSGHSDLMSTMQAILEDTMTTLMAAYKIKRPTLAAGIINETTCNADSYKEVAGATAYELALATNLDIEKTLAIPGLATFHL